MFEVLNRKKGVFSLRGLFLVYTLGLFNSNTLENGTYKEKIRVVASRPKND